MASHLENRVAMARRLADFLEPRQLDLDQLERAGDDEWARIAQLAGEERTPSPATRAGVIIALTERARPLDASLLDGLPR